MIFPPPPNTHALAVLGMVVLALFLFTRERIPLESSSFFVLVGLALGFELFPFAAEGNTLHAVDLFYGFGHEALVAVCSLMIAGQGLLRTGALEPAGHYLARLWKRHPGISLLLTLLFGAIASAFINNVPIVVLLMPVLISVSLRTGASASSVLMPMGLSTLLGGMSTTIGTSTNLLVVSVAADMGMKRLQMFDFLLPALIAGGVGMAYLWLVAPRILPKRQPPLADTSPRVFTAHLAIRKEGKGEGKKLAEAVKLTGGAMKVRSIERGPNTFVFPLPDATLRAGDHLVITDTPDRLKEYEKLLGGTLYPEDSEEEPLDEEHPLKAEDQQMAEAVIGTPIGISIAHQLGLSPEPFVLAVLFGANMSYATPMAYKTNLLILNAGGYTFLDFVRIGTPLAILMWFILSWVLVTMYGIP